MKALDWVAIRSSLDEATAATERALTPTADRQREILEARARELARVDQTPDDHSERLEALVFVLANERYALDTKHLLEVAKVGRVTPVPSTPAFIYGVTNHSGEVLAVIDTRVLFGLPRSTLGEHSRMLVVGDQQPEMGLLCDSVASVDKILLSQLVAPFGESRRHIRAIGPDALIVLDGDSLRTDPELYVDSKR